MKRALSYLKAFFLTREDGGFSAAGIVMLPVFFGFMAVPMNLSYKLTHKERYQGFADTLAYTALHEAYDTTQSLDEVKTKVRNIAKKLEAPNDIFAALPVENIQFGIWNEEAKEFTPNDNKRKAVRVTLAFSEASNNPISDIIFGFFDKIESDMFVTSYASTYRPNCFRNGLIALGRLTLAQNTDVGEGVCIHGKQEVEVHDGGSFAKDSEVAVLTEANLTANYGANPGLVEAIETGRKHIALLSKVGNVYNDLLSSTRDEFTPSFIKDENVLTLGRRKVSPSDFQQGRIYYRRCNDGRRMRIQRGQYKNFVLISPNCAFTFSGGVTLENVMIVTRNGWDESFFSFNRLALGGQNDCAAGTGSVLMSNGGGYYSAGLFAVGSQILAGGKIYVESGGSKRNVIKGSSLIAGGNLFLGANNEVTSCANDGSNEILEADYFRLVK